MDAQAQARAHAAVRAVAHRAAPKLSSYPFNASPTKCGTRSTAGAAGVLGAAAVPATLCSDGARLPHTPMVNLFRRRPYLWSSRDCRMTSFRPTKIQQFAIEAKLNLMFGASVYDRIFLGFEVLEIVDGELRGWAPTEHGAAVIDVHYASKLAWIAETVLKRPIRRVSVL